LFRHRGDRHSPDRIQLGDFQKAGSGIVVLSTGAVEECAYAAAFEVKLAMDVAGNRAVIRHKSSGLAESQTGAAAAWTFNRLHNAIRTMRMCRVRKGIGYG
jgi:hypothetical protein